MVLITINWHSCLVWESLDEGGGSGEGLGVLLSQERTEGGGRHNGSHYRNTLWGVRKHTLSEPAVSDLEEPDHTCTFSTFQRCSLLKIVLHFVPKMFFRASFCVQKLTGLIYMKDLQYVFIFPISISQSIVLASCFHQTATSPTASFYLTLSQLSLFFHSFISLSPSLHPSIGPWPGDCCQSQLRIPGGV